MGCYGNTCSEHHLYRDCALSLCMCIAWFNNNLMHGMHALLKQNNNNHNLNHTLKCFDDLVVWLFWGTFSLIRLLDWLKLDQQPVLGWSKLLLEGDFNTEMKKYHARVTTLQVTQHYRPLWEWHISPKISDVLNKNKISVHTMRIKLQN